MSISTTVNEIKQPVIQREAQEEQKL